eukprot:762856-Hanusia_phi.AAC.1
MQAGSCRNLASSREKLVSACVGDSSIDLFSLSRCGVQISDNEGVLPLPSPPVLLTPPSPASALLSSFVSPPSPSSRVQPSSATPSHVNRMHVN